MASFTDRNADQVHQFALQMGNLGLSRMSELLVAMYKSGAWRKFKDGIGTYVFLPGEFDYFLTQQGVSRDQVLHGIRDVSVKAELEAAMDERRTGEEGYRRHIVEVRREVPERPGNPIEPFGYTLAESSLLGQKKAARREALGRAPRQWRESGGKTTRRPSENVSRGERIARSIVNLDDADLEIVAVAVRAEIANRKRR